MPGLESGHGLPPHHHRNGSIVNAFDLMSDGVATEQVKKFFFTSTRQQTRTSSRPSHPPPPAGEAAESGNDDPEDEDPEEDDDDEEKELDEDSLEVYIPELLQASYNFYTWPSAPVLAWYLWERRRELPGKRILELGSGTALPGILASKCGAIVTLSDSATLPKSLQHLRRSCELNGVLSQVKVVGITWGFFLSSLFSLGPLDLILGSDCFYDPSVFEDIVVTVAFLLERNPAAKFLCTYQERSADWSIEHLLHKWGLTCTHISLANLGVKSGLDVQELMQDHTIHLLDIRKS